MLIETMELLKWTGVPWELVFAPAVSPASFVYNISINGCVPWYVKHFPTGPGDVFSWPSMLGDLTVPYSGRPPEPLPRFDVAWCKHGRSAFQSISKYEVNCAFHNWINQGLKALPATYVREDALVLLPGNWYLTQIPEVHTQPIRYIATDSVLEKFSSFHCRPWYRKWGMGSIVPISRTTLWYLRSRWIFGRLRGCQRVSIRSSRSSYSNSLDQNWALSRGGMSLFTFWCFVYLWYKSIKETMFS